MKCYYNASLLCDKVDTSGMNKLPCEECEHYHNGVKATGNMPFLSFIASSVKNWHKTLQFIHWPSDHKRCFLFIKGNPLSDPAAFHLIYKWSLWIGRIEIRKFLTDQEMKRALEIYVKRQL
jgi:hypothetical protein